MSGQNARIFLQLFRPSTQGRVHACEQACKPPGPLLGTAGLHSSINQPHTTTQATADAPPRHQARGLHQKQAHTNLEYNPALGAEAIILADAGAAAPAAAGHDSGLYYVRSIEFF